MLEDVEDEGRDEHLATGGGSSQHATSSTMPKPRFHILAGFLGRSRQKKAQEMTHTPCLGGVGECRGVEWRGVPWRSGVGFLQAHRQPAKHGADNEKAKP